MSGLFIGGQRRLYPGETQTYADVPALALREGEDCRPRKTRWIRTIVLHTTVCYAAKVRPGLGPRSNSSERIAGWWSRNGSPGGAHLIVEQDGRVCQCADLAATNAYHAGQRDVNDRSVGIEIVQGRDGSVYAGQLLEVLLLVDWLCGKLCIQRQCVDPALENVQIPRVRAGCADVVGVVGHMHLFPRNKPHDPGREIFDLLVRGGFMPFAYDGDDLEWWRSWQRWLGVKADGLPGSKTCAALVAEGFADGIFTPPEAPLTTDSDISKMETTESTDSD